MKVLAHCVPTIHVIVGLVVVKHQDWQSVGILVFELEGEVLHEVVEAPLVSALLKFNVEAVAER